MLIRPRRNRKSEAIRSLIKDVNITANDLVYPVFVKEGSGEIEEVKSLPSINRYSIDELIKHLMDVTASGIKAIALFPVVDSELKDDSASEALNKNNLAARAIKKIKSTLPNLVIIADIALDPYTSHGHDGLVKNDTVDNDSTVEVLRKMSVIMAEAGADVVAPSDMMDGRVQAIREHLDRKGYSKTLIMSYAVKYNSAFYSPFRDAVDSKQDTYVDKASYQMDYSRRDEALLEVELDINEGADWLMVKPALSYLDIILKVKESNPTLPLCAYHVSGEYAMLQSAAENGLVNYNKALMEQMISIKRAGADIIFTYAALDILKIINGR